MIGYLSDFDGSPKNEDVLFGQQQFKELAAVRAGRTVPMANLLPQGYGDALALLEQLEAGLRKL